MKRTAILFAILLLSGCTMLPSNWSFPVYGCWCGLNFPPEGMNPRPVDVWDSACQWHDHCYGDVYRNNEHCDDGFVQLLDLIQNGESCEARYLMESDDPLMAVIRRTLNGYSDDYDYGYDCDYDDKFEEWESEMPGQIDAAYQFFSTRHSGWPEVHAELTMEDIGALRRAGRACLSP